MFARFQKGIYGCSMDGGSVILNEDMQNIPLEFTGKPALPRIFFLTSHYEHSVFCPFPWPEFSCSLGPLKIPFVRSGVRTWDWPWLSSLTSLHLCPLTLLPQHSVSAVSRLMVLPSEDCSSPSRSAQGPPKWGEGWLSFGLNNYTTPHIFSLK